MPPSIQLNLNPKHLRRRLRLASIAGETVPTSGRIRVAVIGGGALLYLLVKLMEFDDLGALAMIVGLALVAGGILKPSWFWKSRRVLFVRAPLGDGGAVLVTLLLGGLLSGFGAYREYLLRTAGAECRKAIAAARPGTGQTQVRRGPVYTGFRAGIVATGAVLRCEEALDR